MCGCTLYDSPTCGHSWMSMSQPCGFLSDLLNCPNRQTYQTLIAPPYTCPRCNGGFADQETIEMVQGPWGCNQMIRAHVGGSYTIPGQWGCTQPLNNHQMGGALVSMNVHASDHRLTGPCSPGVAPVCGQVLPYDNCDRFSDRYVYDRDLSGRRSRKHKSSRRYEYRYSGRPNTNCTVM